MTTANCSNESKRVITVIMIAAVMFISGDAAAAAPVRSSW